MAFWRKRGAGGDVCLCGEYPADGPTVEVYGRVSGAWITVYRKELKQDKTGGLVPRWMKISGVFPARFMLNLKDLQKDLDMNDWDLSEMIIALEEEFDISIPQGMVSQFIEVKDIVEWVKEKRDD